MTAPFREAFVDAHVPDRKLAAIGHCPWCSAELTIDPNDVDGVCTACGARYATESALAAQPRARRRRRSTAAAPPAPVPEDDTTAPRRVQLYRAPIDPQAVADISNVGTVLVGIVMPSVFTLIFLVFALRALLG